MQKEFHFGDNLTNPKLIFSPTSNIPAVTWPNFLVHVYVFVGPRTIHWHSAIPAGPFLPILRHRCVGCFTSGEAREGKGSNHAMPK